MIQCQGCRRGSALLLAAGKQIEEKVHVHVLFMELLIKVAVAHISCWSLDE